jgi:hypothetical protein
MSFQLFTYNIFYADVSPSIGYRFSENFHVGLSGYKRLSYLETKDRVESVNYYGLRVSASHNVVSDFRIYSEVESFRNSTKTKMAFDQPSDNWIMKWNLGVQKRYSLGKGFYAHTVLMYDLMRIKRFPNTEGSALRFGFDYQIRKNKKKKVTV